jgi:hypothetical protein
MSVEVPIHKSSCRTNPRRLYNERFEERLMYVSNVTAKATGRVNVTHAPSKYGGAIIAIRSSTRSNKPNVTNVHADRVGARVAVGTATDAVAQVTGQISVTHVFRDDNLLKPK